MIEEEEVSYVAESDDELNDENYYSQTSKYNTLNQQMPISRNTNEKDVSIQ